MPTASGARRPARQPGGRKQPPRLGLQALWPSGCDFEVDHGPAIGPEAALRRRLLSGACHPQLHTV